MPAAPLPATLPRFHRASPPAQSDQVYTVQVFPSELGWQAIAGSPRGLAHLTFGHPTPGEAFAALSQMVGAPLEVSDRHAELVARLQDYCQGKRVDFSDVPLIFAGSTPFQQAVIAATRAVPYGSTATYGQLAAAAGSPRAARAVGNIMATNTTPLVVPCHRIVPGGKSQPGAYSAGEGVRTKLRLLEMEALGRMPNQKK